MLTQSWKLRFGVSLPCALGPQEQGVYEGQWIQTSQIQSLRLAESDPSRPQPQGSRLMHRHSENTVDSMSYSPRSGALLRYMCPLRLTRESQPRLGSTMY